MKGLNVILLGLFLIICIVTNGQSINKIFEKTHGTWKQPVENFKKLIVANNKKLEARFINYSKGVLFVVDSTYPVKAVHDGTVSSIFNIEGYGYCVIIKYGDYFMSYSPLEKPQYLKGDSIKSFENISFVKRNEEKNELELLFQLYKGDKEISAYNWFNWSN